MQFSIEANPHQSFSSSLNEMRWSNLIRNARTSLHHKPHRLNCEIKGRVGLPISAWTHATQQQRINEIRSSLDRNATAIERFLTSMREQSILKATRTKLIITAGKTRLLLHQLKSSDRWNAVGRLCRDGNFRPFQNGHFQPLMTIMLGNTMLTNKDEHIHNHSLTLSNHSLPIWHAISSTT